MALLSLQEISVRFGGPWRLEGATLNARASCVVVPCAREFPMTIRLCMTPGA